MCLISEAATINIWYFYFINIKIVIGLFFLMDLSTEEQL